MHTTTSTTETAKFRTVASAAETMSCSVQHVRNLIRRGAFRATKFGAEYRIDEAGFQAYLAGRANGADPVKVAAPGSRDAIDAAAAFDRMLRAVHAMSVFGDHVAPPSPLVVASDREVAAQRLAGFVFQALDPERGIDLADWRAWRVQHDPAGESPWLDLIVRNRDGEAIGLTAFRPEALDRMQRWQASQYQPARQYRPVMAWTGAPEKGTGASIGAEFAKVGPTPSISIIGA